MKKRYLLFCFILTVCLPFSLLFLQKQRNEEDATGYYSYPGKNEKCRIIEIDQWNKAVVIIAQDLPDFSQYCIDNKLNFENVKYQFIPSRTKPNGWICIDKGAHIKSFPLFLYKEKLKADAWYSEQEKRLYIVSDVLLYSR